jgi:hypothetical protein
MPTFRSNWPNWPKAQQEWPKETLTPNANPQLYLSGAPIRPSPVTQPPTFPSHSRAARRCPSSRLSISPARLHPTPPTARRCPASSNSFGQHPTSAGQQLPHGVRPSPVRQHPSPPVTHPPWHPPRPTIHPTGRRRSISPPFSNLDGRQCLQIAVML